MRFVRPLLLLGGLTLPAGLLAQQPQTDAWLHGQVLDSATKAPIAGATLSLPRLGRTTVTNQSGQYALEHLPRDTVVLMVRFIGFAERIVRVDLTGGGAHLDVRLTQRAIELDTLSVTAGRPEDVLRNEQAISVMTPQEVEESRGQTLGETIRELPGVAIIQYGPSIAKPVVRGLHSQRLRIMNGGVPQEGQQWGEEHAPEIDAFAANEIEVIRGGGAVLYGSDAIAGVVRVTPKPLPVFGDFGGEFSSNLFANNRQGAASLLLEGSRLPIPLLGNAAWRLQGSYRRAGDARTPDYYLLNTGFKEANLNVALGIRRSWGGSDLSYSRFSTTLGMYLGAHVSSVRDLDRAMQNPLKSEDFSYDIKRPDQRVSHDLIAWRTDVQLGQAARLDVNYGFQYNNRNEYDGIGFASGSTRPAFGLRLYTHSLDIRLSHAPIGRLTGSIGVSGMRQGNLSPGRSFLIPQYRLYSGGIYAVEQLNLSRLTFSAGLRYDARRQRAYQYGDPVIISPDDTRTWDGFSGSLGSTWEFASGWSVASSLGRAWRAPNVSELYSAGVHHGTAQYQLGDSSITTERSINADVTLRHVGRAVRLELAAYQNMIDGYIYLRPFGDVATVRGAYPGYRFSQTDARLRGLEASALFSPDPWWSLYLSGTLVRGYDRTVGTNLFDIPADRLIANVRVYGPTSQRVREPYLEVGTTLVRRQDHVPPNTVYKLPTAGYALLNVEAGVGALRIAGAPLRLSVAVRNLLDTAYRDYLTRYRLFVDDPGRDVVVRLTVPFGDTEAR
ncbi:MAG TPA: TonB-dependent receptor [Gemmatimonadales bacterium]